ncbi:hypothetical protein ABZ370_36150 [Streptomyces sp. NPDC005962]|uniref:hypothetical protein n=1 Tax=Streptomyces sp. NPDC005962 TaxID=3154466 RepID=UPI0033E94A0A
MIISGDGSATADGVPLPVVGEEPVDTAILDTLHGYARSRNAPVTATISDPGRIERIGLDAGGAGVRAGRGEFVTSLP